MASDLSDTEVRNQQHTNPFSQRNRVKKLEQGPKRPTTPMDIRMFDQKTTKPIQPQNDTNSRGMVIRNQQIGEQNQVSTRFNEWDPFKQQNERQKSPHKSKQNQHQSQQQQQQQQQHQQQPQQTSTFAHTFLTTDSSPRQQSGRLQIGSANTTKHQTSQQQMSLNNDMNSSSNLDLMVSGQKLGSRKEASPTNTPRDIPNNNSSSLQRPFTRRLQPLYKNSLDPLANTTNNNETGPVLRPKKFLKNNLISLKNLILILKLFNRGAIDRKKLEPIRYINSSMNSNSVINLDTGNTGFSYTENDGHIVQGLINPNNNEEDVSISENTVSSDKQILTSIKTRKKVNKDEILPRVKGFYIKMNLFLIE